MPQMKPSLWINIALGTTVIIISMMIMDHFSKKPPQPKKKSGKKFIRHKNEWK